MLQSGELLKADVPRPEKGYIAFFGDLKYEVDSIDYHLSTQIYPSATKREP
jgi:hypothetical protein